MKKVTTYTTRDYEVPEDVIENYLNNGWTLIGIRTVPCCDTKFRHDYIFSKETETENLSKKI